MVKRASIEYFLQDRQEAWIVHLGCVCAFLHRPLPLAHSSSMTSRPSPSQLWLSLPGLGWQLCGLTGFGRSLGSKVSSKFLEDLGTVFLHKETNEIGGGVELQGQWG